MVRSSWRMARGSSFDARGSFQLLGSILQPVFPDELCSSGDPSRDGEVCAGGASQRWAPRRCASGVTGGGGRGEEGGAMAFELLHFVVELSLAAIHRGRLLYRFEKYAV